MARPTGKKTKSDDAENPFWITYSDLLSSLVMIFLVLILTFQAINSLQAQQLKKQLEMTRTQADRAIDIDRQAHVLSDLREELGKLKEEFPGTIVIDEEYGVVRIREKVLFDRGQAALRSEGKRFLKRFIPAWTKRILTRRYEEIIDQVILEGHADPSGSSDWNENYLMNMQLTLARAESVTRFIFGPECHFREKEELRKLLTASGRSNIVSVYKLGALNLKKKRVWWNREHPTSRTVNLGLTLKNPLLKWKPVSQSHRSIHLPAGKQGN